MKSKVSLPPRVSTSNGTDLQFYIPATSSLLERRPRTLKHGDTFGVFDSYGDVVGAEGNPEGLYHRDTRYLSTLQLQFEGRRPLLLSSTVQSNNTVLTVDLTNPDIFDGATLRLPRDTIHIVRTKFLWQGACYERIRIESFADVEQEFTIGFAFAADFADIFEVRGRRRAATGQVSTRRRTRNAALIAYRGLDSVVRRTTVAFDPRPDHMNGQAAAFDVVLKPRQQTRLFVAVTCDERRIGPPLRRRFFVRLREARRALSKATRRVATVETSNEIFNEVLCRAIADHHMLVTDTPEGPYPYAGIPWFSTAFGRDGILTAMQLLWLDPELARGVLRFLAARQARKIDRAADAEPGKILHETRQGEMARLGEVPFGLYYGSVDATPLFVMLAGMYYARTGDLATIAELWPHIEAALNWIDTYGDRDGDGFVEYQRQEASGLENQGWKDSRDAIFHADGRLATGPIALCEVQGYVYAAKRHAADMARDLGFAAMAATLRQQATSLREAFEAAFWDEELSAYVLALDGDKRPCRVRSSNAGQVLFTGIAAPERAARLADVLMGQAFFSGWGIRTVAEGEARYNPISYHNGSVWPHDNALIALGMARYGFTDHVQRLFAGMLDAAAYMDLRRLPELFCGFRRIAGKGPTFYPVACSPQAWAGAAPFALLQACLGLEFDCRAKEIRFRHPRLPDFVDEVLLRALRICDGSMDILLRKHEADVAVNVIAREGEARVSVLL